MESKKKSIKVGHWQQNNKRNVTIWISHAFKQKKKKNDADTNQSYFIHLHSLFKYYPLNGFLISGEKKSINIHLSLAVRMFPHFTPLNSWFYSIIIYLYLSEIE